MIINLQNIINELRDGASWYAPGKRNLSEEEKKRFASLLILPEDLYTPFKEAINSQISPSPSWVVVDCKTTNGSNHILFEPPCAAFAAKCFFQAAMLCAFLDFASDDNKESKKSSLHLKPLRDQIFYLKVMWSFSYLEFSKAAKYLYCYPMAFLMKKSDPSNSTLLPPKPNIPNLKSGMNLSGYWKRFYLNRMHSKPKRSFKFAQTLLQGVKRALEVVKPELEFNSCINHIVDTSSFPPNDLRNDPLVQNIFDIIVDSYFATESSFNYSRLLLTKEISQSASFASKRSWGGARQEVLETLSMFSSVENNLFHIRIPMKKGTAVLPFLSEPILHSVGEKGNSNYVHATGLENIHPYIHERCEKLKQRIKTNESLMKKFDLHLCHEVPVYEEQKGQVELVLEPNKVRPITKMDALTTFLSKPLQVFMHDTLRKTEIFSPIGNPIDSAVLTKIEQTDILNELFGNHFRDFSLYVSGDYQGATDGVNLHATKGIFSRILKYSDLLAFNQSDTLYAYARPFFDQTLFGSFLYYPKRFYLFVVEKYNLFGKYGDNQYDSLNSDIPDPLREFPVLWKWIQYYDLHHDPNLPTETLRLHGTGIFLAFCNEETPVFVKMETGQLMGSVLSFPILCLANLSCYILALVDYLVQVVCRPMLEQGLQISIIHYRFSVLDLIKENIDRLPVLINGDDISFKCNKLFYSLWEKRIKQFGFKLSVGKNYVSTVAMTLNSELYLVKRNPFDLIPYQNIGLLQGPDCSKIIAVRPSQKMDMPLSDFYRYSVLSSNNIERSHKRFMSFNKNIIKRVTQGGRRNLFVSQLLGGLGFDLPKGHISVHLNAFQCKMANFLKDFWSRIDQVSDIHNIQPKLNDHPIELPSFKKDDPSKTYSFKKHTQRGVVVVLSPYDTPDETLEEIFPENSPFLKDPSDALFRDGLPTSHYQPLTRVSIDEISRLPDKSMSINTLSTFRLRFYRKRYVL